MTREEKLGSMRSKDLVQYCIDHGIKVSQSRGLLKEARANVIQRILDVERGTAITVDSLVEEFKSLSDNEDAAGIMEKVNNLDAEDRIQFYKLLAEL